MRTHSRLFLLIGILALWLPALLLACGGDEPTGSTPAVESRPTEAVGTGNGGEGDAGGATPTETPGATGEISATNIPGGGDESTGSTPAVEPRPTEAAGTGNGGGGNAGGATPTEVPGATARPAPRTTLAWLEMWADK